MNKKLTILVPVYNEINTVEIIIKKLINLDTSDNFDVGLILAIFLTFSDIFVLIVPGATAKILIFLFL